MAWGLPLRNLIDRVGMNDRPTCPGVSVVSAASPVGSLSQLLQSMTHFVAGRWVGQLQGWMVPHSSKAPSKWFACGKLTDAYWCPELVQARAGETEKCRRAARAGDTVRYTFTVLAQWTPWAAGKWWCQESNSHSLSPCCGWHVPDVRAAEAQLDLWWSKIYFILFFFKNIS